MQIKKIIRLQNIKKVECKKNQNFNKLLFFKILSRNIKNPVNEKTQITDKLKNTKNRIKKFANKSLKLLSSIFLLILFFMNIIKRTKKERKKVIKRTNRNKM